MLFLPHQCISHDQYVEDRCKSSTPRPRTRLSTMMATGVQPFGLSPLWCLAVRYIRQISACRAHACDFYGCQQHQCIPHDQHAEESDNQQQFLGHWGSPLQACPLSMRETKSDRSEIADRLMLIGGCACGDHGSCVRFTVCVNLRHQS